MNHFSFYTKLTSLNLTVMIFEKWLHKVSYHYLNNRQLSVPIICMNTDFYFISFGNNLEMSTVFFHPVLRSVLKSLKNRCTTFHTGNISIFNNQFYLIVLKYHFTINIQMLISASYICSSIAVDRCFLVVNTA